MENNLFSPKFTYLYVNLLQTHTPNGHIKLSKRCISLLMTFSPNSLPEHSYVIPKFSDQRPTQIREGVFILSVKTLPFCLQSQALFVHDSNRSAAATKHFLLSVYTKANEWPEKTIRNAEPKNSLILEKRDEKDNLILLCSKWQINKELIYPITYNSQLQFHTGMT